MAGLEGTRFSIASRRDLDPPTLSESVSVGLKPRREGDEDKFSPLRSEEIKNFWVLPSFPFTSIWRSA